MKQRRLLFLAVLIFIVIVSLGVLSFSKSPAQKKAETDEIEKVIYSAKKIYASAVERKVDLSSGPCLSNDIMPGWVADVVHNPREAIDDLPENQCQAYLEGRAKHFVELDLKGRVVRVQ